MQHLPECQLILNKLKNELSSNLFYHSIYHTLDVYHSAESIAKEEGITDSDLKLLLVGAVYHDAGYLIQNNNHEQISCEIARQYLPQFLYTEEEIDLICGIIMATKIPQRPKTHLEEIICDADLNYLGRTDFLSIQEKLYEEMYAFGYIENKKEWNKVQLNFMQNHHFFTPTVIKHNYLQKEKNIAIVQSKIK
ncbi:HD domain-containing protein [Flavobacterium franklandianum]|uniref:HD domain-containing protein n=1 Tax=Flavobacterium franklandianum TaxID=2594430 RepID=A0A553CM01_9FLAO|nr:HD domain-containing protein [Flavobacterium franklandianum]TRX21598.1 HD domain-containing protein [Flavobacterium franklandianum]